MIKKLLEKVEISTMLKNTSNTKILRLEKSSPHKEADYHKKHTPCSEMGLKSKDIIVGAPLALNELPRY